MEKTADKNPETDRELRKRLLHPSLLQIHYLIELEKEGNKWGAVGTVAKNCGVSHGPVSRFFRECIEHGYLTKDYAFTEEGRQALGFYKWILNETGSYLGRIGAGTREFPAQMKQMVENLDYELILSITRSDRQVREKPGIQAEEAGENVIRNILEWGNSPVTIAIHQLSHEGTTKLSMAHRGFEHQAYVRKNKKGCWLALAICPMQAHSRIDGTEMTGHLSSLKYENQGKLYEAEIKNNKLQIPLTACHFIKSSHGNIKGMIPITVTCSVGKAHMPESTAVLTFWM